VGESQAVDRETLRFGVFFIVRWRRGKDERGSWKGKRLSGRVNGGRALRG